MNGNAGPPRVADGEEILEFLTGVMRGSEDGSTQTMKAAELLGKRMGLFAERVEPPPAPVIVDDIGACLAEKDAARASIRAVGRESG